MGNKRNVLVMGDSYSTYAGYIPPEYMAYYRDDREEAPIVRGVDKTWWKILERENNLNIVINDSFSGSTVCNTVREYLTTDSSFVSRIDKYIKQNTFAEKEIDTMIIFGGTNDSWMDTPLGENKYSDLTADDFKCVLPAFCYLLKRAKEAVKDVIVVINSDLKSEFTEGAVEACKKYKTKYICLEDIDKENNHPTEIGMKQIAKQVKTVL